MHNIMITCCYVRLGDYYDIIQCFNLRLKRLKHILCLWGPCRSSI
jgi:hypothetical protein